MDGSGSPRLRPVAADPLVALPPPLKWAGGKRWLLSKHRDLFPASYERLVEPFVGSGAVFFGLPATPAIIADTNEELIEFYNSLKSSWRAIEKLVHEHANLHSPDYYYKLRSTIPRLRAERSARFLYLNRTCWNGLYRVNRKGEFNVPVGSKTDVLLKTDDFKGWSKRLRLAEISCSDFEVPLRAAASGDFVFVDPPYKTSNGTGFVKYNSKQFTWADQVRLARSVRIAAESGAKVMVTNVSDPSIEKLYKGFNILQVERHGVISGTTAARGQYKEVIIRCW